MTTVSPYDVLDPQQTLDTTTRPYNALWAQLNDLCGSIGFPPKAARTIISGAANTPFVNRLLVVLTYFVRCGEVKRNSYTYSEPSEQVKVVNVERQSSTLKRTSTRKFLEDSTLKVPPFNTRDSDSSNTLTSDVSVKRSATLANISDVLSTEQPMTSRVRKSPALSLKSNSSSSLNSTESEPEQKVVFVLGDDERLVGLKNKSIAGKSVKKSTKVAEAVNFHVKGNSPAKESCDVKCARNSESPSRCCAQTLQHSKSIKHSGFKFEFDKYPQIVTNYMKSKNLEILDRHYIGKPGNLKLNNFQFDPTIVPPIQEERCEACYKCQLMESTLQTPTNASELEYMNDMPRQSEYASAVVTKQPEETPIVSPKIFTRKFQENTVLVNVITPEETASVPQKSEPKREAVEAKVGTVKRVLEFPVCSMGGGPLSSAHSGFDASLLGGVTDHYVPDLILQG